MLSCPSSSVVAAGVCRCRAGSEPWGPYVGRGPRTPRSRAWAGVSVYWSSVVSGGCSCVLAVCSARASDL
eukprot:14494495-Alexandrium_andersonii.AAC.1